LITSHRKLLLLGYSLEDVIAKATIKPAHIIDRAPKLGTLQTGAPGEIAIMKFIGGTVSFVDTRRGVPFDKPCRQPFSVN